MAYKELLLGVIDIKVSGIQILKDKSKEQGSTHINETSLVFKTLIQKDLS